MKNKHWNGNRRKISLESIRNDHSLHLIVRRRNPLIRLEPRQRRLSPLRLVRYHTVNQCKTEWHYVWNQIETELNCFKSNCFKIQSFQFCRIWGSNLIFGIKYNCIKFLCLLELFIFSDVKTSHYKILNSNKNHVQGFKVPSARAVSVPYRTNKIPARYSPHADGTVQTPFYLKLLSNFFNRVQKIW